jgi:hypothetical protein
MVGLSSNMQRTVDDMKLVQSLLAKKLAMSFVTCSLISISQVQSLRLRVVVTVSMRKMKLHLRLELVTSCLYPRTRQLVRSSQW